MSDFTSEYVEGLSRRAHKAEAALARVQELCDQADRVVIPSVDAEVYVYLVRRAIEGEQT